MLSSPIFYLIKSKENEIFVWKLEELENANNDTLGQKLLILLVNAKLIFDTAISK